MNKILKYAGIPSLITLGWAGYLFTGYFASGRNIALWEGGLLLGLMFIVVAICKAIRRYPTFN